MKQPTTHPTDLIQYHSILRELPGIWPDDSESMQALVEDIATRGIDEPLLVVQCDEDGSNIPGSYFLADGRHRLRAAQLAGLDEVPVIVREDHEVADIILSTLVHRRHYTKGALAYLAWPLLQPTIPVRGGDRRSSQFSNGTQCRLKTKKEISAALGTCQRLLTHAKQTHYFFSLDQPYRWGVKGAKDAVVATCRKFWEPLLLSGEAGLEQINKACGYKTSVAVAQGLAPELGGRENHLKYISAAWEKTIPFHLAKLPPEDQEEAAEIIVDGLLKMPADILEIVKNHLTTSRRGGRS